MINKKYDVVALGELLIDFTPGGTGDNNCMLFGRNPGGAPANVLAVVSKYGGKCAFIGKVGDDMFGKFLAETLNGLCIDTANLVFDREHNTTLAFVSLKSDGDREFAFFRNHGADRFISRDEIQEDIIKNTRLFHFGSLSLTDEPAREATKYALSLAKKHNKLVSFDPNYRPLLWTDRASAIREIKECLPYADILKVSHEEAQMLTDTDDLTLAAARLMEYGIKLLFITRGAQGAMYAKNGNVKSFGAYPAKTIDTTGAGDIFFGTCIFELLKYYDIFTVEDESLDRIMRKAIKASGISTERKGAITSIPDYDAL